MPKHPSSTVARNRFPVWAIVASSVGVVLIAIALIGLGRADGTPRQPARRVVAGPAHEPSGTRGGNGRSLNGAPPAPPSVTTTTTAPPKNLLPVKVTIPAIGVSSPLVGLGLNPDHTLQVPTDFGVAGWYIYRPVPGELGPGIIAGHVDSRVGPAVFYRLKELQPGATINVDRNDGSVAAFTVTGTEEHAKNAFPTEQVYGPTAGAELRVITCGGTFNWSTRHYNDNLIVFATLNHIVRT